MIKYIDLIASLYVYDNFFERNSSLLNEAIIFLRIPCVNLHK